jgi:Glycine-rich domain-containing protein-like
VQYKNDCERVYGKILDSRNVESSIQAKSKRKSEEMWAQLYPDEPFELDNSTVSPHKIVDINAGAAGNITYNLVSAANRQCSFYYQVSRGVRCQDETRKP